MAPHSPDVAHALELVDRWWRAANYLSVGQLYLRDNPLLERPLEPSDIKPRLLGHWGTTPGLNFMWAHANRAICTHDLDAVFVCGPGHGGPAMVANAWLEGAYADIDPEVPWSVDGMRRLFARFSAPGGVPSHAAPETPGSFHEGGELGYSLAHAQGAVFDDPDLVAICAVGDGEAETGALATSWHGSRFLDPVTDGAVLPLLHLNGFKIANPTVLASIPETELRSLLEGYGYRPHVVDAADPIVAHEAMAAAFDGCVDEIRAIRSRGRDSSASVAPRWPMIVLRSPKGWSGPPEVDGELIEGHFRSHQIPLPVEPDDADARRQLEDWMRSYRPDELFTADGRPVDDLLEARPPAERCMSTDARTNGRDGGTPLRLPTLGEHGVTVPEPGITRGKATTVAGRFLRDVVRENPDSFRIVAPDELASNRLDAVFETTGRRWQLGDDLDDGHLDPRGRVMEVLSEHLCQGWLEGYVLTGRHGLFTSYEAFIHIVDSMFNQHAKWLEAKAGVDWRGPLPSFNYLLSSHVWRQDHNGFTHQDPGFLDVVANKKPELARIYLPPDTNCLLQVLDHCLRSEDLVNVIVAGKQDQPQYLDLADAGEHCRRGLGAWSWAGTEDERGLGPDVVLGCAGDVPTMETVAAARLLRDDTDLSVRVVNVVDLFALQSPRHHPHGVSDKTFVELFPEDVPVVFAFHGYPPLVHRFTYDRPSHRQFHVRGYVEEGTTTTPFDMVVRNRLDRFNLAIEAVERIDEATGSDHAAVADSYRRRLDEHRAHILEHGIDPPDLEDWRADRLELRP